MLGKRIFKIALLVVGLLPFILSILALTIILVSDPQDNIFYTIIYILMVILFPGMFIYYVIDTFKNKGVKKEQRYLWIALLFFGSFLVYPFYWYFNIWHLPGRNPAT